MSLELSLKSSTDAFVDATPCGVEVGHLDSKILCQSTWAANWFSDLSLNTPLATNPGVGRQNCGAMISSRANFIGDTSSYTQDGAIESSSGGTSSWVASSSFPDQLEQYGPIPQGCISNGVYAFNDKYTNFQELIPGINWTYNAKMAAWGLYVEVRQHAQNGGLTAGSVFGMEVDVVSYGNAAGQLNPYGNPSYNIPEEGKVIQIERAIGIGLSAGGGNLKAPNDQPQITDNTCAIAINGNGYNPGTYAGAKWKRGIVFTETAIRDPAYEAIVLCNKYNVNWYQQDNTIGASISGDSTGDGSQMGLSLTSTNVDGSTDEIGFNLHIDKSFTAASNNIALGNPSYRWAVGYGVKGWKSLSDEREKTDISEIPDLVMDAWEQVKFHQFKLKGHDTWSIGVVAQRVITAFESFGLNALDYDLVTYENDSYSVCYEQALALECACLRRKLG